MNRRRTAVRTAVRTAPRTARFVPAHVIRATAPVRARAIRVLRATRAERRTGAAPAHGRRTGRFLRTRAAVLPLAALLLAATLTACHGVTRALDCAKTAATVAGDVQDLQSNATNIGQVSDPSRRKATVKALDKVQTDLDRIGDRRHDPDVSHAVSDLSASVRRARTSAADGHNPDLRPVGSAAGHLTAVCAQG
ncbi:hypothetical protein AB0399_37030 [Streptomyces sp. NPDC088194]|uniref:hypothetical protein n=1 Tax=Streptomyces sp. NPDC088194 TaxID=3154931 RepID=UPI00344C4C77